MYPWGTETTFYINKCDFAFMLGMKISFYGLGSNREQPVQVRVGRMKSILIWQRSQALGEIFDLAFTQTSAKFIQLNYNPVIIVNIFLADRSKAH